MEIAPDFFLDSAIERKRATTAARETGPEPQLLKVVEEPPLSDPAYWMQKKYDGQRVIIRKRRALPAGVFGCARRCTARRVRD